MPTLADLFSLIESQKRKASDFISNPSDSLMQMLGNANDRARAFNELNAQAAQEKDLTGPANKRLQQVLADAYNPTGIFIGPGAKLWNSDLAFKATQMEKKGISPEEIWKATGTFRSPDKFLRQEIDDSASKFIDATGIAAKAQAMQDERAALMDMLKPNKTGQGDLFPKQLTEARKPIKAKAKSLAEEIESYQGPKSDPAWTGNRAPYAYEHNALYEAYPHLRTDIIKQGNGTGVGGLYGTYNPGQMEITQLGMRNDPRSTATHEFQHAVQDFEGFAPGGNTQYAYDLASKAWEKIKNINDELSGLAAMMGNADLEKRSSKIMGFDVRDRYNSLMSEKQTLVPFTLGSSDPYKAYKNLAGEAEARAVQKRLDMNAEQRRNRFPLLDYDTNLMDLIIPQNETMFGR